MRLFGSDRIARWMDKSGAEEGEVITGGLVTRAIEQAQKRVELQNFQQRKRLLEYDDVMNQQREVIYSLRLFALERGEELKAEARRMIESALERAVPQFLVDAERPEEYDRGGLREALTLQYLVTVDALTDAEATPTIDRMSGAGAGGGRGAPSTGRSSTSPTSGAPSGCPTSTARCCRRSCSTCSTSGGRTTCTISTSSGTPSSTARGARRIRWWSTSARPSRCSRTSCTTSSPRFTERFLKIQVSAERPEPPRAPPPPAARRRASTPPRRDQRRGRPVHGPAAARPLPASVAPRGPAPAISSSLGPGGPGDGGGAGGGAERSVSVRVGEEVQEVPRGGALAL